MRIALVTEIPAPFRIPLFNALAQRADFLALFLAEEDPRRRHYRVYSSEFRFASRVLRGRQLSRSGRWIVFSRGLGRELRRFDPEVVIVGGWNQPASWHALVWATARRRPVVAWVESTLHDERRGSQPLELAKRAFVRLCDGFLVPGAASEEYVRSLRPNAVVEIGPNAVDAELFGRGDVDRSGRTTCTFIYVGRLDAEKGLDTLLRAFRDVPGELVLVGSGTEEKRLRSLADERVRFHGAVTRDDVPELYAQADVFVLPSRSEPWGMVLNEAALAGLPIVATEGVGAVRDLVEDGGNGFVVAVDDEPALANALRRLADDEELRLRFGARSLEHAARFTPDAWADAVVELAQRVKS